MKVSSKKAKGRNLQNKVRNDLVEVFGLSEHDVKPAVMGEGGVDIKLSVVAREVFPFGVECKNQERMNLWSSLEQAEKNSDGLMPLLIFKRNRSDVYACVKWGDFLRIVKGDLK